MNILSLSEVPQLQKLIQPYGYEIHVHDACGGQSFTLKPNGSPTNDEVHEVLKDFFSQRKMSIEYYGQDRLNFIAR